MYQKMIQEVQDYAILLLDKEGFIQNWNQGAEKIKGYTAEEIIGKNFRLFYAPEDINRGLPEQLISEAVRNGRAFHEGFRVRKDKTMFWGSVVITSLHNPDGSVIGFSKVTRDLTEKKLTEDRLRQYAEQLEDKNRELEQFAYIASHDLKEPLRKIIAFGDMVMNNFKTGGERTEEYIRRMQEASLRMMSLINDLLAFSKISNEKIEFLETDLSKIVEQVKDDIQNLIETKNVQLLVDPLPTCLAIPSQMHQLFQNLLSNAIKFNDKQIPEIHITCEKIDIKDANHSRDYKISVKDNGIGFDDSYKERIFDIFQRIHGRAQYGGTGIGLAICKKIMEAHKGSITADAIEGEGAVFTIILPDQQPD
jgi:PAS domain S-box-containing protein